MNKIKLPWLFVIIPAAMVFFNACQDPNETGFGVLPGDDLTNVISLDTFQIKLQTVVFDSSRTSRLDEVLFGNTIDPEFGRIDARANLQFVLPTNNSVTFPDTSKITIDSVFLKLDLSEVYGRFETPMQIQVFEIIDPTFDDTVSYFSNDKITVDTTRDLANGYIIDFSGLSGFIDQSIPLDPYVAEKVIFADTADLASNEAFTNHFHGLHIRAIPASGDQKESGAVYHLDVVSGLTKITMHYQFDTIPNRTYELILSEDAPWFHSMNRTEFSDKLLGLELPNTKLQDAQYQFIQEGMVLGVAAQIPSIDSLPLAGINRAELVLKVDASFFGSLNRYEPPTALFVANADTNGTGLVYDESIGGIVDLTVAPTPTYNSTNQSYTIDVTTEVMEIITGRRRNNGFIVYPGFRGDRLKRVVIGGTGHPDLYPEFRVTYTTLPK